jgi:hypothetical protein
MLSSNTTPCPNIATEAIIFPPTAQRKFDKAKRCLRKGIILDYLDYLANHDDDIG